MENGTHEILLLNCGRIVLQLKLLVGGVLAVPKDGVRKGVLLLSAATIVRRHVFQTRDCVGRSPVSNNQKQKSLNALLREYKLVNRSKS